MLTAPDMRPYGARGRPWNEIVVDPAGRVYVDMPGSMPGEQQRPGVVGVVACRIVADDVWFPNGMAASPDRATLVLAESHAHRLTAFTTATDGDLVDRRVRAELPPEAAPDGICLDAEGESGTPTSRTGAASASPRAGPCGRRSPPTGAASPA